MNLENKTPMHLTTHENPPNVLLNISRTAVRDLDIVRHARLRLEPMPGGLKMSGASEVQLKGFISLIDTLTSNAVQTEDGMQKELIDYNVELNELRDQNAQLLVKIEKLEADWAELQVAYNQVVRQLNALRTTQANTAIAAVVPSTITYKGRAPVQFR